MFNIIGAHTTALIKISQGLWGGGGGREPGDELVLLLLLYLRNFSPGRSFQK